MILFVADNHYGQHCGRHINDMISDRYPVEFHEDDWSCLEQSFVDTTELLILNMIAGTCNLPLPGSACEAPVREYMHSGRPVLLLHGGSAAFWHWAWWRTLVGYRWVRSNDPDSTNTSWHPKRPYAVRPANSRHPLIRRLQPMDLPEDEIYLNLEQTCPCWTLMETTTKEGTFPMAYECRLPGGGHLIGFLPGHSPEVTTDPRLIANICCMIDYLTKEQ